MYVFLINLRTHGKEQTQVVHKKRSRIEVGTAQHTDIQRGGVGGLHVDLIAGDLFTYIHPSRIFTFRRTQLKEPPSPP